MKLPQCIGYWIPSPTCSGGWNHDTKENEKACTWQTKCRLFQEYLVSVNRQPTEYLSEEGEEAAIKVIEKEESKIAKKKKKRKKKKRGRGRPKKVDPMIKINKRYSPIKKKYWNPFLKILKEKIQNEEELIWSDRRLEAIYNRSVYPVIEPKKAKLYIRLKKSRPWRICNILFTPNNDGLDLRIPWKHNSTDDLPDDLKWTSWTNLPLISSVRVMRKKEHFEWAIELIIKIIMERVEELKEIGMW